MAGWPGLCALNWPLIGPGAFFNRSYRYNRPPNAPPFRGGGVALPVIDSGLNSNEQVFQPLTAQWRGVGPSPSTRLGDKT